MTTQAGVPRGAFPFDELVASVSQQARERLEPEDRAGFLDRLGRELPDLVDRLLRLYGDHTELPDLVQTLLTDAVDLTAARPARLRALDRERAGDPGWFQRSSMTGYVCYVDRFAGTLAGVRSHLDYLGELGVTYLHLMPLLEPREGENDGGYAVRDWDAVDPRLGTMADLEVLADDLHRRGMVLCQDFVLNHTAREHEWAAAALAGDAAYRGFFLFYPDRTLPDAYEETLPEIFPGMAPGSFTWVPEVESWVWTTFREFQWDLNYANPAVFRAMLATMLRLANHGADVLRLDAAPFLWKRLGTTCMDEPETHLVLQAFRALTRIAAPGVLLKAEAMLPPDQLGAYLGDHDRYRPECDLAYDNQLMVMLWSMVATGDSTLATQALTRRRPAPAATSWVTYLRCHDDIGWAVADADASAVGLDGPAHRRFLSEYFAGDVTGSTSRGARFQANALGEAPTSGTAAALLGIEAALLPGDDGPVDEAALAVGLTRLESLYSVVYAFGGVPLVYMGDELAMVNDAAWEDDPGHVGDNRWMHRPFMDWSAAGARHDATTVGGRVFPRLARLGAARAATPVLGAPNPTRVLRSGSPQVFAFARGGDGEFVAAVNLAGTAATLPAGVLAGVGVTDPALVCSSSGGLTVADGGVVVPPWEFVWVRQA